MTYYIVSASVIATDTGLYIPVDPDNSDYQAYLAWVAAGNTPTSNPFVPPASPGGDIFAFADVCADSTNPSSGSRIFNETGTGFYSGYFVYNNGDYLGLREPTGTGKVVLATSPTIVTPTIAKIANLTTNGFVKTSGGDGTLAVDTTSYSPVLSQSIATVTTADINAAINTFHYLDVSGMMANRYLVMPSATAIGQRCAVYISTGSSSFSLIPYMSGPNQELGRLFISNEYMSFVAVGTGASSWIVENDGRKPCVARVTYSGSGQSFTSGSVTNVTLNSSVFDNASLVDTTNSRLKIRRTGKYALTAGLRLNNISAAIPRMLLSIRQTDTAAILGNAEIGATSTTLYPGISVAAIAEISEGKTVDLLAFQNSGSSQSTASAATFPHLAMQEILT